MALKGKGSEQHLFFAKINVLPRSIQIETPPDEKSSKPYPAKAGCRCAESRLVDVTGLLTRVKKPPQLRIFLSGKALGSDLKGPAKKLRKSRL